MKKVVVSAPGKLHLSGEHAVVHGKPAVVVATSKRLYVALENQKSKIKNQNDITKFKIKQDYIAEITAQFEKKYRVNLSGFSLHVTSDIPIGAGMGSSAALAVAIIGALGQWVGKPWNPTAINELAFQAEKHQHINASGSDPTIVTHGGILWYRKELDFLKTFWLLPFKIPKKFSPFILINTGRTESAGELIAGVVGNLRKRNEKHFILFISQIEDATRKLVQAIHDENELLFRQQVMKNERLLEQLGVVSVKTKQLISDIEKAGGVAKISGAGGVKTGSGIVIAIHNEPKVLAGIAKKNGFPSFQVQLGGEGVKLEQVVV